MRLDMLLVRTRVPRRVRLLGDHDDDDGCEISVKLGGNNMQYRGGGGAE